MALSLKEHIRLSREAVEANRAKGNRHSEFLKQVYADPCRFLEEILQNTEDAYSRKGKDEARNAIRFCLFRDHIDINHNGIDFDVEDLKAITTFAGTTKTDGLDINQIGKFGIGFRSVYSVTDKPEIHCRHWHFRIEEYEILEEIAHQSPAAGFGTLIRLPFKTNEEKKLYTSISEGLKNLNEYSLLFPEHLNIIEVWNENKLSKQIERRISSAGKNLLRAEMIFTGNKSEKLSFLLLKPQTIKSSQEFAIGLKLGKDNDGREEIVPDEAGRLFVYFPTMQPTQLQFIIHGNFTTTPTREYVPFDRDRTPENIKLLNRAAAFMASSLTMLREQGFMTPAFISILPLKPSSGAGAEAIYPVFAEAIKNSLMNKKLLPMRGGGFASASDLAMTSEEIIPDLIDRKGLEALYQRSAWLDEKFNNYPQLTSFLENELGIKNVNPESLAFRIAVTPGFLKTRRWEWFVKFYRFLSMHSKLWDEAHRNGHYSLRMKEIILLQNGQLSKTFDDSGNPLVYLASGKTRRADTIDPRLLKDDGSARFFRMLGIREYDAYPNMQQPAIKEQPDDIQSSIPDEEIKWNPTVSPVDALVNMELTIWREIPNVQKMHTIQTDIFRKLKLPPGTGKDDTLHESMMQWCLEFAVILLKQHYQEFFIAKAVKTLSSGDLIIEKDGERLIVFIAYRLQFEINYRMHMQHWLTLAGMKNETGHEQYILLLIADAGTARSIVTLVNHPEHALKNGQFIFEHTGFRILDV